MAYTCGSSIYISLFLSGPYTTVHIRQHMSATDSLGKSQINTDGLFISIDEFSSLLFQLNAIEQSFAKGHTIKNADFTSQVSEKLISSSLKRKHQKHPSMSSNDETKLAKNQNAVKTWYAIKVCEILKKKLQDDCFSCLMGLNETHICNTSINHTSHNYLEKFFETVLSEIDCELVVKELSPSVDIQSISSLIKKKRWKQSVKNIIQERINSDAE